jgi:hypothetical protein
MLFFFCLILERSKQLNGPLLRKKGKDPQLPKIRVEE